MTPFSFPDTQAIIALPPVHVAMLDIVRARSVTVERIEPWQFGEARIPTEPFRLFRAVVSQAVKNAFVHTIGKERERLLTALRMIDGDNTILEVADEIGRACEDYAVVMQYGGDGLRSYREVFR